MGNNLFLTILESSKQSLSAVGNFAETHDTARHHNGKAEQNSKKELPFKPLAG